MTKCSEVPLFVERRADGKPFYEHAVMTRLTRPHARKLGLTPPDALYAFPVLAFMLGRCIREDARRLGPYSEDQYANYYWTALKPRSGHKVRMSFSQEMMVDKKDIDKAVRWLTGPGRSMTIDDIGGRERAMTTLRAANYWAAYVDWRMGLLEAHKDAPALIKELGWREVSASVDNIIREGVRSPLDRRRGVNAPVIAAAMESFIAEREWVATQLDQNGWKAS